MRSKAPTKDYIKKRLKKKNQPEAKHKRRGEKKKKKKQTNNEKEGQRRTRRKTRLPGHREHTRKKQPRDRDDGSAPKAEAPNAGRRKGRIRRKTRKKPVRGTKREKKM